MFSPMSNYPTISLKPGRERSVESRHPWIFSGALPSVPKDIPSGAVVDVYSSQKQFLACGFFNSHSQISIRILSFERDEIDQEFFEAKIKRALASRKACFKDIWANPNGALRLVYAESDELPGLIVDRYGDVLVVQFLSAGMKEKSEWITSVLRQELSPKTIYEKSAGSGKNEEGLTFKDGLLYGEPIKSSHAIEENGLRFLIDIARGQKTGFYLDLRDVRSYAKDRSEGKMFLNIGCYTGSISFAALAGGAKEVHSVDSSEMHLELLEGNLKSGGHDENRHKTIQADMFEYLRHTKERYDMIVLDPPAFAHREKDVPQAIKGYKELHLSAMKLLKPGGELITLSCSHHITREIFEQTIFYALKDLKMSAQVIRRFDQHADHHIHPFFPEGNYFKGCVLRRF